jgi:hypothetical protein
MRAAGSTMQKNFTTRDAVRKMINGLVGSPEGRLDPVDMIARIVEVVPAADGAFRNIHPALIEEALKTHQKEMFERGI